MINANKKIVFLTCKNLDGYVTDDALLMPYLQQQGWTVDVLPWDDDCDWSVYRAAIVRTTWDYTERLDEFLKKISLIATQTQLVNSLETIYWNAQKKYLKDLKDWGLNIIPTEFSWPMEWSELFKKWKTSRIMVKPQVGANSSGTHIVSIDSTPKKPFFTQAPLVQPLREKIFSEGELSFHFFSGKFSHAIRKVPKSGDYRVQEEHGGKILFEQPDTKTLAEATEIFNTIEKNLTLPNLYHRLDLVRNTNNELEIMEVELIEPSLYFRTYKEAPVNFVAALNQFLS